MILIRNVNYNLEIAKSVGIYEAIFITCLNDEFDIQSRNSKLVGGNTVSLSRQELYERTGLDDTMQIDAELSLQKLGIIAVKPVQNIPNKNYYILDLEILEKVINNPEEALSQEIAHQFIRGKRVEPQSKRQKWIADLKKKINVESPILRQKFVDWIDAVYGRQGFLSPTGVVEAQQHILAYSEIEDVQVKVLNEAIKGGLAKMEWAIERYEKDNHIDSSHFASYNDIKADKSKLTDEVF